MSLSYSTQMMIARSDYWCPETAKHLRRVGGPIQTDKLICDIFSNIRELTKLINIEKVNQYCWFRDFKSQFETLFKKFHITCDVYAFDMKIETYEFEESFVKDNRFYSCLPLMDDMSKCLKSALSFHDVAREEIEKISQWGFLEKIPTKTKRKVQSLLDWWDNILSINNGIIPETPEIRTIDGCDISPATWKERTETLTLYVEEYKKGKNPTAHLEAYL
jgi:hypothetical protein